MRSKLVLSFILMCPLAASSACSSDAGTDASNAGSGTVAGAGGTAGHSGTANGGRGGGVAAGDAGSAGEGGTSDAGSAGEAGNAGAGGAVDGPLQDGQVLKVLVTVNEGEIAAAQTALAAGKAASVLDFAQMMVTDHTLANGQLLALVGTKHIPPEATNVSERLDSESAALLLQLSTTSPASFDQVYMQSQVAAHQEALTLIDTRLTPGVTDADLKMQVAAIRTSVMTHLTHAEAVLAAL
jgi:putative membrane protein